MLNSLTNYLLGTSNQPTGGVEESNVRLTSVISEDDWVLVDRYSEGDSEAESERNSEASSERTCEGGNEVALNAADSERIYYPGGIRNSEPGSARISEVHLNELCQVDLNERCQLGCNNEKEREDPMLILNEFFKQTPYEMIHCCTYNNCSLESRHYKGHSRSSSTASLPYAMEESWFLTPPPCFTSAGPVHMETSPLENLLIEHPSMSVYQDIYQGLSPFNSLPLILRQSRGSSLCSTEDDSVEATYESAEILREELIREELRRQHLIEIETEEIIRLRQQRLQREVINTLRQEDLQGHQRLINRQAQKTQLRKTCQSLKRKYLERANKAREVNNRNRHQRRSERSQGATRSYANNNRKC